MKFLLPVIIVTVLNSAAIAQWNPNSQAGGTRVTATASDEKRRIAVLDNAGGAVIAFESQGSVTMENDIYVQRIDNTGAVKWGSVANPVLVFTGGQSTYPDLQDAVEDGSGGIYVSWYDEANNGEIFLQHISSNGAKLWGAGIKIFNNAGRDVSFARLCSDGAGGVIIAWNESLYDDNMQLTTYAEVFAQRYNSAGTSQWTTGGIKICTAPGIRGLPNIVPDGSNGAVITFIDTRNSTQAANDVFNNIDIYAQRVNSSGALQWTAAGAAVNTQPYNQFFNNDFLAFKYAVPDGAGGIIVLFDDFTGNNDGISKFYAQRLNSSGARQWPAAGAAVCTIDAEKKLIRVLSDSTGGMLAVWEDARRGTQDTFSNYSQHLLANGSAKWAANGIELVDNLLDAGGYVNDMIGDGQGNYIFTWVANTGEIKAQKIDANGNKTWNADGVNVSNLPNDYAISPQLVPAGNGAVIVHWLDGRDAISYKGDIYASKLNGSGALAGSVGAYVTASNGNWNSPATWAGGVVPPVGADVIIKNQVTITADATCNSLTVQQPGTVTVNTGIHFTVLH